MKIEDEIINLKGIGEKTGKLFAKLDINTMKDLLYYFPRNYEKMNSAKPIGELTESKMETIYGIVASTPSLVKKGRFSILRFSMKDSTGSLNCVSFNTPFLAKSFRVGDRIYLRGRITAHGKNLQMEQPRIVKENEYLESVGKICPIYPLMKGLSNNLITKSMKQALKCDGFANDLPQNFLNNQNLFPLKQAIWNIHFPNSEEDLIAARNRIIFDEFCSFVLAVQLSKKESLKRPNENRMIETAGPGRLAEALPYALTDSQRSAYEQIKEDMCGPYLMNRLLQGDVGSGKTIVAVLSLLLAVENGYQGAMMAPTEVLANQHFENIKTMMKQYHLPFKICLLTGSTGAKDKRLIKQDISHGNVNLIIGTHALIQDDVSFHNLGLVVTDEQHRFGVNQRESLIKKGNNPHILVMSATPIPRSLAMILFGDMNLSIMNELPKRRMPIKNCVVDTSYREKAYKFIEKEVRNSHQVYVICPMVDESETMEGENVVDYTEKLKDELPDDFRIHYLHGKMKASQKNQIMEAFARAEIDILVSTTVIEVGIDVPNATVIMIENAERFGLAQLHQLRGRVGRGQWQSYCIFINTSKEDKAKERLEILNHSNDGFYIAEEDLKLRGPGDFSGIMQSGFLDFAVGDIYQDAKLMEKCNELIRSLMESNRKEDKDLLQSLRKYYLENGRNYIDFRTI